ncbi:MAG: DEAD/DEAH box helicase [Candidatus Verstraetearchaeota archaeon]|nr:DEAD/DEAH box helicase [Candidatus Verstraetearchaeota archaeon]
MIRIRDLPIDENAKRLFEESGINELYPPQAEAMKSGLLEGKNVVMAVPTASGKTLVAEICAVKHILEKKGKVLYLVPLRALASEKYDEFKKLSRIGVKVVMTSGDFDSHDLELGRHDLIIATNEKADSIFRHSPPWIDRLSLVVADEIHLLGDPSRGPTLESILTRIKFLKMGVQVLALSATISNAEEISAWLGGVLVTSDWRPVSLREGVFYKGEVTYLDGEVRRVPSTSSGDPVADLALDVIGAGGQILIFTGSRNSAVSLAKRLEAPVGGVLRPSERKQLKSISEKVLALGERTKLTEKLSRSVSCGVAFHHAGLTYEQRKAIEDAFRSFKIKCICATPTLAAGVNTPARRVLVYDYKRFEPGVGRVNIPVLEYKQMAGRAGRPKYDTLGEAVLLSRSEEERDFLIEEYLLSKPEKVWSKLGVAPSLRSQVLAIVAMGIAHSRESVREFFEESFCAYQYGINSFSSSISESLSFLVGAGMLRGEEGGAKLIATPLGTRVSELYIDPKSAKIILDALSLRRVGLPAVSYLSLICHTPDMPKLYVRSREVESLDAFLDSNSDLLFLEVPKDKEGFEYEMLLSELKTTLLLKEWIEEAPEEAIVENYDVGSGDIYAYVESARWILHAAQELARLMGYSELVEPLRRLRMRVENGIREELLPLVSLKGIGRVKARALYSAGYRGIDDLKRAQLSELRRIPQIGPETVKAIVEQVGRTLRREEWSSVSSKSVPRQLSIDDYSS